VARGRPQEDLALDAEIDRTYMSRLERGRVNSTVGGPRTDRRPHISEFFGW
jgi:hypothetical protein